MSDRTVHARYPGMMVVRYDRAGKWYLEPINMSLPRQRVTVAEAAGQAVFGLTVHGEILTGLPGGQAFDRKVQKLKERALALGRI